jgi:hypothetical protein
MLDFNIGVVLVSLSPWPSPRGNLMEEGMGVLGGAVEQNRGPHLTSALLIPPSERLRCTRFRPGPAVALPSVPRFLTVRTCVVGPV